MARPQKKGLDYFPLDVDFMQDRKVRRIKREHGLIGVLVVIELYTKIYHENGYYLLWEENIRYDISEELNNENPEQIEAIVESCLNVGLFHDEIFKKTHVLTSAAVQRRFKACAIHRSSSRIAPELNLLEETEQEPTPAKKKTREKEMPELFHQETETSTPSTELSHAETPQTKEKEIKAEKREINSPHTPSQSEEGAGTMSIERLKSYCPPPDYALNKKKHNYEGLLERLFSLGIHTPDDIEAIMRLSRYGEIGHPVWGIIVQGKWAGEKKTIASPGKYLIKVLLNLQKQTQP
ncbi:DUF4373 domain-containing protein [uncultured Bacteroides sp.]|uniref:DUF4373 domain-containing protein n=1 Tax=uncultured Bacteroides sp. TaxID=162156 RepID=UPI002AAAC40D|nr:DUF4373 domain-containing protein [uncultured Bacteroides sp.]